jgi:O-antigen ligase
MPTDATSRVPLGEWLQAALLGLILAWNTIGLGGYPAEVRLVSYGLTAALLAVHLLGRLVTPAPAAYHPAGWLMLPFVAYAAVNAGWVTPVPWLGWLDWLGWVEMITVFWVVVNGLRASTVRSVVFLILIALGIAGVLAACYQRFLQTDWMMFGRRSGMNMFYGQSSGTFAIPNSFAGFLILLLPACAAQLFRRSASEAARIWWGWVTLVLTLGLLLTISRGAWLALAVALVGWPLVAARGGWGRRIRIAGAMVVVLTALGMLAYWKSPKVRDRFVSLMLNSGEVTRPVMWRGAWRLFLDAPVVGTGAGSYNVMFERHRPERFRDEPLWAHNEYLNTLSDYGLVGFTLFFGAAAVIVAGCVRRRRDADERRRRREWIESATTLSAFGVGVGAFLLQAGLDFHFKIPALALAFAVVAGLAVARAWPAAEAPPEKSGVSGWLGVAIAIAVIVGLVEFVVPRVEAEGLRREGRRDVDRLVRHTPEQPEFRSLLGPARRDLEHATKLDPRNAQAWSDLSYALAQQAFVTPADTTALGRAAEEAADRALQIAPVCSEFWIRRGVARDMQARWTEASADFAAAVAAAPADAYAWYFYAEHLLRLKAPPEAAEAALAFCLRLDPQNPSGVALRQRLATNSNRAH